MSITTLQRPNVPVDEYVRILDLIEAGVRDGVPLWGQVATRPVGLIMTLESRIHPLVPSSTYQRIAHLPLAKRVEELRRAETRAAIVAELAALPPGTTFADRRFSFVLGDPPRYDRTPEESLSAIAAERGVHPAELAYDTLLENDGRGAIYCPATNFEEGNFGAVRRMLTHPHTVPALGDAGAHATFICDASFPTYLLAYWATKAPEAERLPVEWVVKRQCHDTAALVGLNDRGVLAPGFRADVNVIDLDGLSIGVPEMRTDLPAGGKRLVQTAKGYKATIVGGEVVSRDGEATGALPGRLVRGPQAAAR